MSREFLALDFYWLSNYDEKREESLLVWSAKWVQAKTQLPIIYEKSIGLS